MSYELPKCLLHHADSMGNEPSIIDLIAGGCVRLLHKSDKADISRDMEEAVAQILDLPPEGVEEFILVLSDHVQKHRGLLYRETVDKHKLDGQGW